MVLGCEVWLGWWRRDEQTDCIRIARGCEWVYLFSVHILAFDTT